MSTPRALLLLSVLLPLLLCTGCSEPEAPYGTGRKGDAKTPRAKPRHLKTRVLNPDERLLRGTYASDQPDPVAGVTRATSELHLSDGTYSMVVTTYGEEGEDGIPPRRTTSLEGTWTLQAGGRLAMQHLHRDGTLLDAAQQLKFELRIEDGKIFNPERPQALPLERVAK